MQISNSSLTLAFEQVGLENIDIVGGKNASLGEMQKNLRPMGINTPNGFATTAFAYWAFIRENNLEKPIAEQLLNLRNQTITLEEAGRSIRRIIDNATIPTVLSDEIQKGYEQLSSQYNTNSADVAVRSSATAEDLPGASFAGLHETYLNIRGKQEVLKACKNVMSPCLLIEPFPIASKKGSTI